MDTCWGNYKMLLCKKCGKSFNPESVGHVDDHMEICDSCWRKEQLRKALSNLGKSLAQQFRLERQIEMIKNHG